MGFDEAPAVCQLIGNCLKHWMLLLMTRLCLFVLCQGGRVYLMRSSKEGEFVGPISCPPGSVVIVVCHDDHQKMKGFLSKHGSWGFASHLMCSGGATHIVATWRVLTSGINAPIVWLLGFLLNFSFCALVFKLPFFLLSPLLSPTLNHCFVHLLLQFAIFFKPFYGWAFVFCGCFLWDMSLFSLFLCFFMV